MTTPDLLLRDDLGQRFLIIYKRGAADLVLFKARIPSALANSPWKGDKTVYYASGAARLLRLELRQTRLRTHTWDKLPAWALDRALDGYPDSIDGVLGVAALGCRRIKFDFEKSELGWTR